MERIVWFALSAWMFWSPAVFAKPTTVVDGEWEYAFDEKSIPKAKLEALLIFSDHSHFQGDIIERCPLITVKKAALSGGGWEAWSTWGPSWVATARGHVKDGMARVETAKSLDAPAELRGPQAHVVNGAFLHLQIDAALLDMIESNNAAPLGRPLADIDPATQCADALANATAQPTREGKLKVARVDWNNCVISRESKYPTAAWRSFLKRYRIAEHRRKDWAE